MRIQEIGEIKDEEEIEEWKQCFGFAKAEDPRGAETPDPKGADTSDKAGKCEEEESEVSTDKEQRKEKVGKEEGASTTSRLSNLPTARLSNRH